MNQTPVIRLGCCSLLHEHDDDTVIDHSSVFVQVYRLGGDFKVNCLYSLCREAPKSALFLLMLRSSIWPTSTENLASSDLVKAFHQEVLEWQRDLRGALLNVPDEGIGLLLANKSEMTCGKVYTQRLLFDPV
jgi:hypothetical protein